MARKRQQQIPGTERPDDVEAIDEAIAAYVAVLYERMELQRQEPDLLGAVHAQMLEHKRKRYTYTDGEFQFDATLDTETRLHVKRRKVAGGEVSE